MKKMLIALLLCICVLSACAGHSLPVADIYRVVAPHYRSGGSLLEKETFQIAPGVSPISSLISAFNAAPEDVTLMNPMHGDAYILGYRLNDDDITLEVSEEYLKLSGYERTAADCCAVLTFCSLDFVNSVSIQCGGKLLLTPKTPSDIQLQDETVYK